MRIVYKGNPSEGKELERREWQVSTLSIKCGFVCIFTSMSGKVQVVKYYPKDTWLALPIGSHTNYWLSWSCFSLFLYLFDCIFEIL